MPYEVEAADERWETFRVASTARNLAWTTPAVVALGQAILSLHALWPLASVKFGVTTGTIVITGVDERKWKTTFHERALDSPVSYQINSADTWMRSIVVTGLTPLLTVMAQAYVAGIDTLTAVPR